MVRIDADGEVQVDGLISAHGGGNVLIVGDAELQNGAAQLRNMTTKEQREIALDGLVETLIRELKE